MLDVGLSTILLNKRGKVVTALLKNGHNARTMQLGTPMARALVLHRKEPPSLVGG